MDPDQASRFFFSKIVSMIRKYHNHKPKTNTWKSHTTITRHQEDKPSKATSSLFRSRSCLHFKLSFDHPFIRRSAIYWPLFILRGKHMAKYDIDIMESLPGVLETGEMTFIPGEQGKRSNFEWNRVQSK